MKDTNYKKKIIVTVGELRRALCGLDAERVSEILNALGVERQSRSYRVSGPNRARQIGGVARTRKV